LQPKALAPGRLATLAAFTLTTTDERNNRDEVAFYQTRGTSTQRHYFSSELVAENITGPLAIGRIFRHVQIGTANTAAPDLYYDLARARGRVGQIHQGQRLV
jgi:hypothetical protein